MRRLSVNQHSGKRATDGVIVKGRHRPWQRSQTSLSPGDWRRTGIVMQLGNKIMKKGRLNSPWYECQDVFAGEFIRTCACMTARSRAQCCLVALLELSRAIIDSLHIQ